MNHPHLMLASQSPRRRELLKLLGLPFEATVAEVREAARARETPAQLATRLSRAKATSLDGRTGRRQLVIGCDTVVALEDNRGVVHILGKPGDGGEAAGMLRALRGRSHTVFSAITVSADGAHPGTELVATRLRMRRYSDAEIAAYVASGDPLDKAGAYAIQHAGFHPVDEIEGCYTSVMGLPLCHLTQLLRRRGCPPPVDVPAACQAYTARRCDAYKGIMNP